MRYGDLLRTHPSLQRDTIAQYDALYRGGVAFRRRVRDFLPRNPLEDAETYALRLRSSPYRSYVGPIVDAFASELFGAPFHIRAGLNGDDGAYAGGHYSALKEDCDGCGTDLVAFMKERFISAVVKGYAWILAELPDDGGMPARDAAEFDQRDLGRATLRALDAEHVLDWEMGRDGALLWAITHACEAARPDPRAGRDVTTETFRLYDRETVETYVISRGSKKTRPKLTDEIPPIGPAVRHRFPRVPLVCISPAEGHWLLNRIADSQVAHFQLHAAQTWALQRACYPLATFKCEDGTSTPETGSGYVIRLGLQEKLEYVQVPTAAFDTLAKAMSSEKDEIYRVASQMAAGVDNNAVIGRTVEATRADTKSTETCLIGYGQLVKEAIEAVYELVSDAFGDIEVTFSIEGLDRFDLDAIAKTLENLKAVDEFNVPSPTLKRELWRRAAELMLPIDASEEVKAAIRREIAAANGPSTDSPDGQRPPGTAEDGRTPTAPGQGDGGQHPTTHAGVGAHPTRGSNGS